MVGAAGFHAAPQVWREATAGLDVVDVGGGLHSAGGATAPAEWLAG